ncbi:serine/threonine-protein kinase [Nonomuraea polychroma]|uniref:serine/threonine-protein kinase n=1 Tax=Nonomuraea polychroma TaxID=46176 RepID=UPI003D8BA9C7
MSDATERAPSLVADRYRLDELIGSGPIGEVWRGYDTRADWVVAVKVLGGKAAGAATRERLRRHAQAVAKVIHPNVAMVLDVGEHDGAPFLVMEYLTGLSLGEELAAGGPMKIVDVCDLIGQASAGLDAAHRAGVVHGEIDPDSFRRAGSGVLKVVGFGLGDEEPSAIDGRYMAPERAAGGKAQTSGDVYALGCVCYELLAGRPPFEARERAAGTTSHGGAGAADGVSTEAGGGAVVGDGPPVPPSAYRAEVPAELDRLVLAMIAEDPAARPSSGEAIRRSLAAIARPRAHPGATPVTGAAFRDGVVTGPARTAGGAGAAGAAHAGGPVAPGPGAVAGHGATEVYPLAGPGAGGPFGNGPGGGAARAGDTAVYQAGDLEAERPSNRKLFVQLGVAVAAIVAVTVAMVMWAGGPENPVAVTTPSAAPTVSSQPSETPDLDTDPSPGTVITALPDTDPSGSLRETPPAKATLGTEIPPGGWRNWLGRFDEAVSLQEGSGGINPQVAAKAREKILKANRKLDEGKPDATLDQIAEVYRDLQRAQQKGDMEPFGPLAEFMNEWRLPER